MAATRDQNGRCGQSITRTPRIRCGYLVHLMHVGTYRAVVYRAVDWPTSPFDGGRFVSLAAAADKPAGGCETSTQPCGFDDEAPRRPYLSRGSGTDIP